MNKKLNVVFTSAAIMASLLLSGCQLLTGYQQIEKAENADSWAGKISPVKTETSIACFGTYHCEIILIDKTSIISPTTHQPVDNRMLTAAPSADDISPLLDNKSVKIVPLAPSSIKGLTNYYARVKPVKREVHINFYPENNLDYVERFAVIHEFVEGTYQLRAYRQKNNQTKGSLLENASPDPLCVDLIHNDKVQRHFCKQTDTDTQGEFVEKGLSSHIKVK